MSTSGCGLCNISAESLYVGGTVLISLALIFVQSGMEGGRTPETKPRIPDEIPDRSKSWKLTEITEQSQCRSTRLPDTLPPNKVCFLFEQKSQM